MNKTDTPKKTKPSYHSLQDIIFNKIRSRPVSEYWMIFLTALIVGVGAGLGAVFFRWLINSFTLISYGGLFHVPDNYIWLLILLVPAIGGAIYGPMIYFFAREAKGHGVPEVMEAVALHGGRIRPIVAVIKSLASALCIGTGGSVGREGPIAQIGSAIGSTLGQWLHLSDERVRNLVACGAAGGIAATFNAPIAGAVFALEIILGEFHTTYFGAVVISAVTADVVANFFEGNIRAFAVPEYTMISPWELLLYLLLGVIAGILGVLFSRSLYLSEDLWEKLKFPEAFKPVIGGLTLGVVGLLSPKILSYPRVYGVGYPSINDAVFGKLALEATLVLLFMKLLATIITLGAGGSGGIFAPSLFMGAMLGSTFGQIFNTVLPNITAPAGAYALVGMAAFFSSAAHAPITAILILFEMTNDYQIILPLMLTTVVATLISRLISPESIYTLKLVRRGIHLRGGKDVDIMDEISVAEAMTKDPDTVPLSMTIEELTKTFDRTRHHGFTVVDDKGNLAGVVTIQDLKRALEAGNLKGKTVADIATTEGILVAYPDEPMGEALRKLSLRGVGRIPVVAEDDHNKLVGVVRRNDIIRAYNIAMTKRADHRRNDKIDQLAKMDGSSFLQITLPEDSPLVGKRVGELNLPPDCLIISIKRGEKLIIAHGFTTLKPGDQLTVFSNEQSAKEVSQYFSESLSNGHSEE
jgi:CIC family chloride channel protein